MMDAWTCGFPLGDYNEFLGIIYFELTMYKVGSSLTAF